MSKETFYFSHDYNARSDIKIKDLIVDHGMLGYGIFWSIIEDLYNNANALPLKYKTIAYDLRVDESIIKSIINDFDLFDIQDEFFGSVSVQRRLDERNAKSNKARESALYRWNKDKKNANASKENANALHVQSDANAIKESKVKESKVNNINKDILSEIKISNDNPLLIDLDVTNEKLEVKITKSLFDLFRRNQIEQGVTVFKRYDRTRLNSWLTHIDKMIRIDKVTREELQSAYVWLSDGKYKNSEFWRKNILSTEKLREQYPKLQIAMKEDLQRSIAPKNERTKSRLGL